MEVFRYTTSYTLERDRSLGFLNPHWFDVNDPIYAFPEHPLLWGVEESLPVLKHIRRYSGYQADTLLRFDLPISDFIKAYVQEGQVRTWDKSKTNRHVSQYRRQDYNRPEVVIWWKVPVGIVEVVEFPQALRR